MSEEIKKEEQQELNSPQKQVKTYSEDEYNSLKKQLDEANSTIQSYKDMDIEGIKKSVEDYKQKLEKSENDRKAFEHKTKISNYVKSLNLRDEIYENHVTNLLIEKGLQFDGDKLIGGDDVVNSFKENHSDAFKAEEKPAPFTAPTSNSYSSALSGIEQAFYNINPNLKHN